MRLPSVRQAFNLTDNPFDPELPEIGRRSGDPINLQLYKEEKFKALRERLCDLVCMDVAGMAAAQSRLTRALFRDKNPDTEPVQRSAILLIVGPSGSGRSTLANMLAAHVLRSSGHQANIKPFKVFDLPFSNYVEPPDLLTRFAAKVDEISQAFSDFSGNVLLVIENLPGSAFNQVLDASERLIRLNRVFIVTSTDSALLKRDLDASIVHIEAVELTRLTAEQVAAWIKHRVPQYRNGDIPALRNEPESLLFPFAESALRQVVGKPLQQARNWAYKRIDDRRNELAQRPNLVEAVSAELDDLRARMIT
jgi:energy-coupling factor transporter ATP-binding protein EcfA2